MTPYYEQDGITIYHGDCREILPTLDLVDLVLTDPPYGVNYESNFRQQTWGKIEGDDGSLDIAECISLTLRRLPPNRHIYVFGPLDLSSLAVGPTVELIWDKGKVGSGDLSLPWGPSHERIAFAVHKPYQSMKANGGGRLAARLRQGSVIRCPKINNGRGATNHPTEKPTALLRQLIESSSCFGETVLDPFMGSGSTLIAAQMEGRGAIGIELSEAHCETAVKRLQQTILPLEMAAD